MENNDRYRKLVDVTYLRDYKQPAYNNRGYNPFTKYHGHPSNEWIPKNDGS